MSKIKVGEYIRPFDEIEKVTSIDNDSFIRTDKHNIYYPSIVEITKYSTNIIDLIEEGDYVNGKLIYSVGTAIGGLPIVNNTDGTFTPENMIKSIVTKEQFAESEYKIV